MTSLRALLHCPPEPYPPDGAALAARKSAVEARLRRKLNRKPWFQWTSIVTLTLLLSSVVGLATELAIWPWFVIISIAVPILVSGACQEVDVRFPRFTDFARATSPRVYIASVFTVGVPLLVGYVVHTVTFDLAVSVDRSSRVNASSASVLGLFVLMVVVTWAIPLLATAAVLTALRWMPYFAFRFGMPLRGCFVESLALSRVATARQVLHLLRLWAFPSLFLTVSSVGGILGLLAFIGIVLSAQALSTGAIRGAIEFHQLIRQPVSPYELAAHDLRATAWHLPRRSVLAAFTLISYPFILAGSYALRTAAGDPLSPDLAKGIVGELIAFIPLVLGAIAVMFGREGRSPAPAALCGALGFAALAAWIAGVVILFDKGMYAASQSDWVPFTMTFLTATLLLAGWILGHRSLWWCVVLAPLGGFLVASQMESLNQQLAYSGIWKSELIESNASTVGAETFVVSIIFAAVAWAAYGLEAIVISVRRNSAPSARLGHPQPPAPTPSSHNGEPVDRTKQILIALAGVAVIGIATIGYAASDGGTRFKSDEAQIVDVTEKFFDGWSDNDYSKIQSVTCSQEAPDSLFASRRNFEMIMDGRFTAHFDNVVVSEIVVSGDTASATVDYTVRITGDHDAYESLGSSFDGPGALTYVKENGRWNRCEST